MTLSTKDIAWLAGLLEGEGCFRYRTTPMIQFAMTDKDVVGLAAGLLGAKSVRFRKQQAAHWKPQYEVSIHGQRAAEWMMTLYPLMGERRQAKIREILAAWRLAPRVGKYVRTVETRAKISASKRRAHVRHDDQPLASSSAN